MKRALAGLTISALLLGIAFTHAANATETEADVIAAIVTEWGNDSDTENNAVYMRQLDALYPDASPDCQKYIAWAFVAIALYDSSVRYADNPVVSDLVVMIIAQAVPQADYACRIAI